jgi:HlyD family secretion protein
VLRLNASSEAPVALGAPLLELGDTTRLEVVAELLTADALQVRPGAVVRVDRWGGPVPLGGRVQRVEPGGYTKVSALGVEEQRTRVVIELTDPAAARAGLGDGFRVAVAVRVQAQAGALKVPVSAVFPRPGGAAGEMAVFRVEDGRARQVAVRLGGRNGQEAWVTEGLAEGETVIVYPARTLTDGLRVKAGPG